MIFVLPNGLCCFFFFTGERVLTFDLQEEVKDLSVTNESSIFFSGEYAERYCRKTEGYFWNSFIYDASKLANALLTVQ